VRLPAEADPATFYAYVVSERTPVGWLPLARPLHPVALASPAERAPGAKLGHSGALAASARRPG
jgi:hypothetical protein